MKKAKKAKKATKTTNRVEQLQLSNADDSDSDFEYLSSTPTSQRKQTNTTTPRQVSSTTPILLRPMLEKHKLEKLKDVALVPRPSIRDPPARTEKVTASTSTNLVPVRWPPNIVHLADNYNPLDISFPNVQPFGMCSCDEYGDCWFKTCANARVGVFCDVYCCPWGGMCSNGTRQSDSVRLMRIKGSDILTVQAIQRINEGVVIGEYLGELSLVSSVRSERQSNEGFRLHFHSDGGVWGGKKVCVNAMWGGTLMRFLNHSCSPNTRFHEVANGRRRTIVVVTSRTIRAGEEVTVDYGDDLWFDCQCEVCSTKCPSRRGILSEPVEV